MKGLQNFMFAVPLLMLFTCVEDSLAHAQAARQQADTTPHVAAARRGGAVGVTGPVVSVPTSGRFKALIVFVRFRDDVAVWTGCTPASQAWAQPDILPAFAGKMLASSPNPPFPESSLTDYFYQQSQGRFTLYGIVYPHVVVTDNDEEDYRQGHTNKLRLEYVTKEILGRLNADPAVDLSDYDANNDGYIDHVFFVLRKMTLTLVGGASGVGFVGYSSSAPEYGNNPQALKRIDASKSGSYIRYSNAGNIFPEVNLLRLMAHEFGHDLWTNTGLRGLHVGAIGGTHGTPVNGTEQVGYLLMAGTAGGGGQDRRGDELISAYERDVLDDGWISCTDLTTEGRYRLTDLYSDNTANCYKLRLPSASAQARTLYLSNRQRIGFFDQLRTDACTSSDHGLKTTGLLATVVRWDRVAVVTADDTLALSNESRDYAGDMYGPETRVQLTPWTKPNIMGYSSYPEGLVLGAEHYQAIDNIGYRAETNGEMIFDYVRDFRERPVIREDSWMGAETAGYEFANDVVVTGGSVLRLNTQLFFSGMLRVEAGSTVVIEAGAEVVLKEGSTLDMADDTRLVVRGVLDMQGVLRQSSRAEIVYENEDGINTGTTAASAARPTMFTAPYPNPFTTQTTIVYELSQATDVTLCVYDALGRMVAKLVDERQGAGRYEVLFEGNTLPNGVYFSQFVAGSFMQTRQMVLIR